MYRGLAVTSLVSDFVIKWSTNGRYMLSFLWAEGFSAWTLCLFCWPARFLGMEGSTANSTAELYNAFHTSGPFNCRVSTRDSSAAAYFCSRLDNGTRPDKACSTATRVTMKSNLSMAARRLQLLDPLWSVKVAWAVEKAALKVYTTSDLEAQRVSQCFELLSPFHIRPSDLVITKLLLASWLNNRR